MLRPERILYVERELIKEAARNKEFLAALAFCVMVKANYSNSRVYKWNWKALIKLCHCNLNRIKQATREAFDNNLIRFEGESLVCNSFRRTKGARCAVLHIRYDDYGSPYIYIKSNLKETKKQKIQTISDIEDVILSIGLLHGIGGYIHTLDTWLRNETELKKLRQIADINRGVTRKCYDIVNYEDPATMPSKRGYCLDKILNNIFNNSISKYKLRQLISTARKSGILKVWKNYYKFAEFECDEYGSYQRPRDMKRVVINHKTRQTAKRNGAIYIDKHKSNIDKVVYYRRMANGYLCTADYSHYKKNWKLINNEASEKERRICIRQKRKDKNAA